jgi:ComF family protein
MVSWHDNPQETVGDLPATGTWWRRAGGRLVDIALPPQCLACATPVTEAGGLCPSCWSQLRLIEHPLCHRLGTPLPYDAGPNGLSADAIATPPVYDRCRSVAVFDDTARRLVHGLKYRDQMELAAWIGRWMARAGAELLDEAEVIIPVPLHRGRLWSRRFNQAVLLAAELAHATSIPLRCDILERRRATRQQVGLSSSDRSRNVRGAFAVTDHGRQAIRGARVLVVDDVTTTGATLEASARTLLRAGAAAVDVLVFARVVRGQG